MCQLETLACDTLLRVVQPTLDTCGEDDPRYPYLVAIEERLLADELPVERLRQYLQHFAHTFVEPEGDLEGEFRQLAEGLSPAEWQTSGYLELLPRLQDSDYLQARWDRLSATLASYRQTTVTHHEVTLETVVGHRLLVEGLEAWLGGLELLAASSPSDGLAEIERGNRLLVAVQHLNQKVKADAVEKS